MERKNSSAEIQSIHLNLIYKHTADINMVRVLRVPLMIIMIICWKFAQTMAIFSLRKLFKAIQNYGRTCTQNGKEEKESNRRATSAIKCVQIYANSSRFILTITISIYLSLPLSRSSSEFGLVFHFVSFGCCCCLFWIQIGKPIIYTSNFGRRWFFVYEQKYI